MYDVKEVFSPPPELGIREAAEMDSAARAVLKRSLLKVKAKVHYLPFYLYLHKVVLGK